MVNGFILEKLAGKKKRCQLEFCRELAKLLIAGYNGYKRPSDSGKHAVSTFTTEENLRGHFLGKLEAGKELVPCVPRLGENARKTNAAPTKCHTNRTHVNSEAFLCVAKCGVKGLL